VGPTVTQQTGGVDGVLVISGAPGAGKTTVSRMVAARFERSVCIEGDLVGHHFIVNGLVPPEGPKPEANRQLDLRRRNTCALANAFRAEGFVTVVDDVVVSGNVLDQYRRWIEHAPLRLVQLTPRLDVLRARDANRDKQVFDLWSHLHDELHERMERVGLWLDSSDETAADTVEAILARVEESIVPT
jgi:adenylylsulfate kinase-like enzyme